MNKELTPLEALKELKYVHDTECGEDKSVNERFALIEKELKALEIIKSKGVAVGMIQLDCVSVKEYNDFIGDKKLYLTEEYFKFLKEVLI